ncbi:unnamed protein product [Ilex paraguariensis]|uniref:Uncharacterized protein n=1 Tax=Ilex paraguariensis TaxID=185542 RepID=A0ABC8V4H7_9AQUA
MVLMKFLVMLKPNEKVPSQLCIEVKNLKRLKIYYSRPRRWCQKRSIGTRTKALWSLRDEETGAVDARAKLTQNSLARKAEEMMTIRGNSMIRILGCFPNYFFFLEPTPFPFGGLLRYVQWPMRINWFKLWICGGGCSIGCELPLLVKILARV